MTIICAKEGVMAADSWSFTGPVGSPLGSGDQKIVRAPDGSLVACAGPSGDCWLVNQWVLGGMDFHETPKLSFDDDDDKGVCWLWMRPSGALWYGDTYFNIHPISAPAAIGVGHASDMALGCMLAGATAEEAARIATERCNSCGGPIQVERL